MCEKAKAGGGRNVKRYFAGTGMKVPKDRRTGISLHNNFAGTCAQATSRRCALDGDISASSAGLHGVARVRYFDRSGAGLEPRLFPNCIERDVSRGGSHLHLALDVGQLDVAAAAKTVG